MDKVDVMTVPGASLKIPITGYSLTPYGSAIHTTVGNIEADRTAGASHGPEHWPHCKHPHRDYGQDHRAHERRRPR